MKRPLVSIVVVCHNHKPFIREALESVSNQTYPNVQLIVVDDSSHDGSVNVVNALGEQGLRFEKILLTDNVGYCKAFNMGLARVKGDYVIDLAADDLLLPTRVEQGVSALETSGAGVDFCDVYYIDHSSAITGTHYDRGPDHQLLEQVPQGNIFRQVLERYFICAPGMMIRKEVLDFLCGYDEDLYYEDFDFWVRSSRNFSYHFTDEVLVKKRVLQGSMSKSQYLPDSRMLPSTLKVCQKAYKLCHSQEEYGALAKRLKYELRQAALSNNYSVAVEMNKLLGEIEQNSVFHGVRAWVLARGWDLSCITRFMGKAR